MKDLEMVDVIFLYVEPKVLILLKESSIYSTIFWVYEPTSANQEQDVARISQHSKRGCTVRSILHYAKPFLNIYIQISSPNYLCLPEEMKTRLRYNVQDMMEKNYEKK